MKPTAIIALALLSACATPEQRTVERALRLGAAAYHSADFAKADSLWSQAPGDAGAVYNRGNAAFRRNQWTGAVERYAEALRIDSTPEGQQRTRYNQGAAHLSEARDADTTLIRLDRDIATLRIEGNDIAQKVATYVLRDSLVRDRARLDRTLDTAYAVAIAACKAALRLDPSDDDARHNLVLAQRGHLARQKAKDAAGGKDKDKDKDQQLGARARIILQQADSLVDLYRFKPALQLLQQGLKEDPSLGTKKEYMQKLETVNKAANDQ